MTHYHIHWFRKTCNILDWERFETAEKAKDIASRLVLPGEKYGIERFDGHCPTCAEVMKRRTGKSTGNVQNAGQEASPGQAPAIHLL